LKNLILILTTSILLVGCNGDKPSPKNKEAVINLVPEDYEYYEKDFITSKELACESYFLGMCRGKGDPKAQNYLGVLYLKGDGVERDLKEAVYWFKKAAAQGNADAQYRLGTMYYSEDRSFSEKLAFKFIPNIHQPVARSQSWPKSLPVDAVSQDKDKALMLFQKSSEQGHSGGQYMLAVMYSKGNILKQDNKKANNLYTLSANQGFSPAYVKLAEGYLQGIGTKINFEKSVYWYERALKVDQYFYGRENKVKRIKDILVPMQKLADEGNAKAQYEMGQMYNDSLSYFNIPRNSEKALFWYKKAAENNYAPAQYYLGNMYSYGSIVKPDKKKSLYWYHKAAEQGHAMACYALYELSKKALKGNPDKLDEEKEIYWLTKAAENNYSYAQYLLGSLYAYGTKEVKDIEKALYWYKKAAIQGETHAGDALYNLYSNKYNKLVKFDKEKAIYWLNEAKKSRYKRYNRK